MIERPCGHSVRAMEIRVKTLQDEERDLACLALKHLIPDAAFRTEQKKLKAEIAELTDRICEQTSKEVTEAEYMVITEYDPEKVKKFLTKVIVLKGTVLDCSDCGCSPFRSAVSCLYDQCGHETH